MALEPTKIAIPLIRCSFCGSFYAAETNRCCEDELPKKFRVGQTVYAQFEMNRPAHQCGLEGAFEAAKVVAIKTPAEAFPIGIKGTLAFAADDAGETLVSEVCVNPHQWVYVLKPLCGADILRDVYEDHIRLGME